jgi:hypothetical protein
MRNKRETLDERDALVERLREFIRFGYVTGSEVARRISRGVSELRRYRAEARFSRRGIKGVEMARHNEWPAFFYVISGSSTCEDGFNV